MSEVRPLEALRAEIDSIDDQLVELLAKRADIVLQVRNAKKQGNIAIYSPDRERQILDRVLKRAEQSHFPLVSLEKIFINIISATRSLMGDLVVSYLGPDSSFALDAASKQFGLGVSYQPEATAEEVVARVERGDSQFGVLPASLSSTGLVARTFDVLMQSNLVIIAEVEFSERVALLSSASSVTEVQRIYSDAYCFARSSKWLRTHAPRAEQIIDLDMASAAKRVQATMNEALLAPEGAAERFTLPLLARSVDADHEEHARFIVVGTKTPLPSGRDKTSMLVSVEERSGALRDILLPFSERGLTMQKIESRPMRNRAWEYVFFIDVAGHQSDPNVQAALTEVAALSSYFKVLGSYPAASTE